VLHLRRFAFKRAKISDCRADAVLAVAGRTDSIVDSFTLTVSKTYRLRKPRANKGELRVRVLAENESEVVYYDPDSNERNRRGKAEFHAKFEPVK
jgi:hypothetical protein